MTSPLLVKPHGTHGRVLHVTPASAGWTYVGFDLYRLRPGDHVAAETLDREACLVLVEGKARIRAGGLDFGTVGERASPFDGAPHAVYVPAGSDFSATAEGEATLAVCTAPGIRGARPPRHIKWTPRLSAAVTDSPPTGIAVRGAGT